MLWPSEEKPYPIVCRPALPKDTRDVMELTRRIWEGEDYVPHVWSQWLQDPDGMLAVAECGGVVVGLGKLTRLSPTDWWFEGLRVHPEHVGKGIASHLDNYLYSYWLSNGSGHLRLATSSRREPVIHLSRKKGFQLIGEFTTYMASTEPTNHKTQPFMPVESKDIHQAVELLLDESLGWLPAGLMDLGWQWTPPRPAHLEKYVLEDQVWWWHAKEGLLVMVPKSDSKQKIARIRMLACRFRETADMLRDARSFAGYLGYDQITWLAPFLPGNKTMLLDAGFERDWEGSLVLFAKSHPQK